MNWNLNDLYTSFDSREFKDDLEKLDTILKELDGWTQKELRSQDQALEKLEGYLNYSREIKNLLIKLYAFSSLKISADTSNQEALVNAENLQMKMTELTSPEVRFKVFLRDLDLEPYLEESSLVREHEFFLREIQKSSQYMLSEKEELILAKMDTTGASAWSNLQDQVSASLLVDIELDGLMKALPLTTVRNMAYSPNRDLRKQAYEAELRAYEKIEKSSAAALNGIKGQVLTNCQLRGYESPLEMTLIDSRLKEETLEAMLTAMKESFPDIRRYFKAKAQHLGYSEGLPFYELFAPIGSMDQEYSYQEAGDYVVKNFRSFSDELADFAQTAIDQEWIDVYPKEGKVGGAFCSNLHPIGQSRFLLNFDGSFSDILTMAHELGHGYHGHQLVEESVLNSSYPMPIAETASIFCETIVLNAALEEAQDQEVLGILEASLQGDSQVIVDIYSRYLFESELFERRKSASLSVEEMKEIMISSQLQTYGDGLDKDLLHPYMWICKSHYYSADLNFYNFPYAFGLLFAKGLYARYLEDKDRFRRDYNRLLAATGKKTIEDVALMMDIDVTDPEFFKGGLNIISRDIDRYVEEIEKL